MALKKAPKKEDTRRVKVYFDYGYPGIDRSEEYYELPEGWDRYSEEEKEKYLDQCAMDELGNSYVEFGAYVVEKEGD